MSNNKVALPKEVAEAIDNLRGLGLSNYGIITGTTAGYLGPNRTIVKNYVLDHQGNGKDSLVEALVNGYEVERTPHDDLREFFDKYNGDINRYNTLYDSFDTGVKYGIRKTLHILGITIEGINDSKTKGCE